MTRDSSRADAPQKDGRAHDVSHAAEGDGRTSATARDDAARRLGFSSYEAILKASTPITARDGRIHLIVEGHDGRWLVWREETWPEYRTFESIHHAGRAAGEEAS